MPDYQIKRTTPSAARKTRLFRINHRLGTLFAFAQTNDKAAVMFATQWAEITGDAPGEFSIDRMTKFKRDGHFAQNTQAMLASGIEGLASFSDEAGWTILSALGNQGSAALQ